MMMTVFFLLGGGIIIVIGAACLELAEIVLVVLQFARADSKSFV
jgi:hypothetical protein